LKTKQLALYFVLVVGLTCFRVGTTDAQRWDEWLKKADSLAGLQETDSALAVSREALGMAETSGASPEVVLAILDTLGQMETRSQHFADAEGYYRRHLELSQKTFGANSGRTAESLYLLAGLVLAQGRFLEADSLYSSCLAVRRRVLGNEHPKVAITLDQLGLSAYDQGRFADAEQYATRAVSILEGNFPGDRTDLILALNNLARTYDAQCRYERAEETYQRALSLSEAAFGPDHLYVASELTNLGIIYWRQHKNSEAESYDRAALDIYSRQLDSNDVTMVYVLRALGAVCEEQSRFPEAEESHRRALAIDSAVYGMSHPYTAIDLSNMGSFYLRVKKLPLAERYLSCAVSSLEEATGPDHPDLASLLSNLSDVYREEGRWDEARSLERRAYRIRRENFRDGFDVLSEEDALLYSSLMRSEAARLVSLLLQQGGQTYGDRKEIAETILATKGQVSDGMFIRHRFYAEPRDPALRLWVDSLNEVRTRLAELWMRGVDASDPAAYRAEVILATDRKNRLESDLARRSASVRRDNELWDIDAVRVADELPPWSILVEFYRYEHDLGGERTESRYLAVVITRGCGIYLFPLGKAEVIDDAVADYQAHFQSFVPTAGDAYREVNRVLYPLIWAPMEVIAGSAETVFIAPDGALNAVSFAALMDNDGRYLIEKYAIHYVMSGRDVLRFTGAGEVARGRGFLAFGDPDFDHSAGSRKNAGKKSDGHEPLMATYQPSGISGIRSRMDSVQVLRLPATRREVKMAAESWRSRNAGPVRLFLGAEASEECFKQECSGWRVIHVATHGFYIKESAGGVGATFDGSSSNPLLRSGLLLAGANARTSDRHRSRDDGFLTAEEVAQLNLTGTQLVVLSACVSGLGDLESGEGVYGLRRAFQMAGARTVISALWPVDDRSTAEFMGQLFSAQLGETLPQTMQRIALSRLAALRRQGKSDHPFYWAAFVATGDWRTQ
jgi:CHAT domain-containing protein/tetratricopeptide (TPR) repeat protein